MIVTEGLNATPDRRARTCSAHPRLPDGEEDVDARDKGGHDGGILPNENLHRVSRGFSSPHINCA
jgi:hypothetical protein